MGRILVTGAAQGIGREVVELLAPEHEVVALGRSVKSLAGTAAAQTVIVDLAEVDSLEGNPALRSALTQLDGIVHCAGLAMRSTVETSTIADWTRLLTLNVVSVAELTRLALPALRAARGTVILLNSTQGLTPYAGSAVYAASKAAMRSLGESLRADESEVRVCSIFPGRVATEMQRALRVQEGKPYEPEMYIPARTVAEAVVAALTAPPESMITDVTLRPRVQT